MCLSSAISNQAANNQMISVRFLTKLSSRSRGKIITSGDALVMIGQNKLNLVPVASK